MSASDLLEPGLRLAGQALHLVLVLLLPPLLIGIINKVKAFFAGRNGPPVLQLYYDLAKLWRKGAVFSTSTTWVFRLGPVAAVVTALGAALLLPLAGLAPPLSFHGDAILFAYLLALGRFCTVLSALDTGSAFEGMGASREVSYSCLAEPALFLGLAALAMLVPGDLSLSGLLGAAPLGWERSGGAMLLVLAAWWVVALVENCRIPFDDPNTHLELTMIHEVMVLDHSGPPLALILYGAALKLLVLSGLIVGLCLPRGASLAASFLLALGGLVAVAVTIGVVESVMARFRLLRVPQMLVGAGLLATFGVLLLLR